MRCECECECGWTIQKVLRERAEGGPKSRDQGLRDSGPGHLDGQKGDAVPLPVTGLRPSCGWDVILLRELGIKRLYYVQFVKSHTYGRTLG